MRKVFVFIGIAVLGVVSTQPAQAITFHDLKPQVEQGTISAQSVIVLNQITGTVLYQSGQSLAHVPASLTKLLTALVVLDTKPNWNKICTITQEDEVGGVRINAPVGTQYTMLQLLNASLIPSANNATHALSRCTGMTEEQFVQKLNLKAASFGATSSSFVEPTGISEKNVTTAEDFAKIANAAFSTARVRDIARVQKYRLCSRNKPVRCETLANTNQLLGDKDIITVAGKTGYLDEALYNFAGSFRDRQGRYFIVVVLGSGNKESRFQEAKQLVQFASDSMLWQDFYGNPK